jgi:hypothetical protein
MTWPRLILDQSLTKGKHTTLHLFTYTHIHSVRFTGTRSITKCQACSCLLALGFVPHPGLRVARFADASELMHTTPVTACISLNPFGSIQLLCSIPDTAQRQHLSHLRSLKAPTEDALIKHSGYGELSRNHILVIAVQDAAIYIYNHYGY